MNLLFLQGINDSGKGRVSIDKRGKPVLAFDGSCNVYPMTRFRGIEISGVTLYGGNARQPNLSFTAKPALIFNQISDPDSHGIALKRAKALCDWAAVPVINHPDLIQKTTRDEVSRLLSSIPGVRMPRTIRFQADSPDEVLQTAAAIDLEPPFIVRIAGDHGGKSMVRLNGPEDREKLHVFPFGRKTFYLTEFVDYADKEGRYQKQRIVFVAGEPIVRHTIYGAHWNVHGSSRIELDDLDLGARELDRTRQLQNTLIPLARPALDEIANRLQLDYFGLDCHMGEDGSILVFEANANMNVFVNKFPALEPLLANIRDHLCAMFTRQLGRDVTWEPGLQA